jgi:trehalose utilization protein
MGQINVTIWNEFRHEQKNAEIKKLYPLGMHHAIADHLKKAQDLNVTTATLDQPEHGLTDAVLNNTDVMLWWGHMAHGEVKDAIVDKVHQRVLSGMGLIVLHSGHFSKIFRKLMGTNCSLKWREVGEKERLWNIAPGHPITAGLDEYFELPHTEMYGERFDIPEPDKLIFITWYAGGEVFRSGCVWERGNGKIFYFAPGHESLPIYHDKNVLTIIENAVRWARPQIMRSTADAPNAKVPLEKI